MSRGIGSARPVLRAWRRIPGPPRDPMKARLLRLYRALLAHHGPQRWWPAPTPFEVAVGAILTQHTAWRGAARAVEALRARGLLRARTAGGDAGLAARATRPALRHLSAQGAPAARLHPLAARALRRRFPRGCAGRRSGRSDARCCGCPASGRRRPTPSCSTRRAARCSSPTPTPAACSRVTASLSGRSRVRGRAGVSRGAPALGSRALQRAPRAAGRRRQVALPHRTALRVAARCVSTSAAGRRRPRRASERPAGARHTRSPGPGRPVGRPRRGSARARARSPISLRWAGIGEQTPDLLEQRRGVSAAWGRIAPPPALVTSRAFAVCSSPLAPGRGM